MPASYPTTLPNLLTADLLSDYFAHDHKITMLEELQAVIDTLGTSPHGAHASVAARLARLEQQLGALSAMAYRELRIEPVAAAPTTQLRILADYVGIEGGFATSVDVTLNSSTTGLNGMASGARQANTTYHIWLGQHASTLTVAAVLAATTQRSALPEFAGYTRWRRVGSVRTNNANAFVWFRQRDQMVSVADRHHLFRDGSAPGSTDWQTLGLRAPSGSTLADVPPTATVVHIGVIYARSPRIADRYVRIRPTGSTQTDAMIGVSNHETSNGAVRSHVWTITDAQQRIDWRLTNADGSTGYNETGVYIALLGWLDGI